MTPEQIPRLVIETPIKLVSEANAREHWAAKLRRKKQQQDRLWLELVALGLSPSERRDRFQAGATITLQRIGGREMDRHDNLPRSFKSLVDCIATWLMIDDGDPRLTWHYGQIPGGRDYSVRVTIEPALQPQRTNP